MKQLKAILFVSAILISSTDAKAQYEFGLNEFSVLISNSHMGIPFVKLLPIHPGIDISATFLRNERPKTTQRFSAHLGYIHHSTLLYAPYLKTNFTNELKIKNTIGIESYLGVGYLHGYYPGDGYRFDAQTKRYQTTNLNQGFFLSNAGVGISYIKPTKIKPFLKYDVNFLGFQLDFRYLMTNFKLGVTIDLQNN